MDRVARNPKTPLQPAQLLDAIHHPSKTKIAASPVKERRLWWVLVAATELIGGRMVRRRNNRWPMQMTESSEENMRYTRSVLIVEDDFIIALQLLDVLEAEGFRVLGPVGRVLDAISLINSERPDTAVLDVNLGEENVAPVALHLRTLGVPYVLASARNRHELAWNPLLADVLNLGKPTDAKHLVDTLRSL